MVRGRFRHDFGVKVHSADSKSLSQSMCSCVTIVYCFDPKFGSNQDEVSMTRIGVVIRRRVLSKVRI